MAGITAKTGPGDDAEAFQAQDIGHCRYQAIQFQLGGVRMLGKFRPQQQFTAEPGKVGRGHMEISCLHPLSVTEVAGNSLKTLGFPGAEHSAGTGSTSLRMRSFRCAKLISAQVSFFPSAPSGPTRLG
jgi:hypothetical protein